MSVCLLQRQPHVGANFGLTKLGLGWFDRLEVLLLFADPRTYCPRRSIRLVFRWLLPFRALGVLLGRADTL